MRLSIVAFAGGSFLSLSAYALAFRGEHAGFLALWVMALLACNALLLRQAPPRDSLVSP